MASARVALTWLRQAMTERWWSLPDQTFRLAITLVALAEDRGEVLVTETTGNHLAALCRTSRRSMARSLAALVDSGFCAVSSARGRAGASIITIAWLAHLIHKEGQGLRSENIESPPINRRPFKPPLSAHLEVLENVKESLADLGDLAHLNPDQAPIFQTILARDQDLLRSGVSDLRSGSESEDLRDPKIFCPSLNSHEHPHQEPPQEPMDQLPLTKPSDPAKAEPEAGSIEPTSPGKTKRKRIDATLVPERAWKAADYLRHQVLIKNPAAVAGTDSWTYGWTWSSGTGSGIRIGDGSQSGKRLAWANSFRLFHAKLAAALGNAQKIAHPDQAWDEIAKTVHWLFHAQPAGVGFVVECPDTLRDKWDRIQAVRMSGKQTRKDLQSSPAIRIKHADDQPPLDPRMTGARKS